MALLGAAAATPAAASRDVFETYVAARLADASGDPGSAARLLAELIRDEPGDALLRRRAIAAAIEGGDMELALQLGRGTPVEQTPFDLRLLMVADELRRGKGDRALAILNAKGGLIDTSFFAPFVEAWLRADRRDPRAADSFAKVAPGSAIAGQVYEHHAFILLKQGRAAEALPLAEAALAKAEGRADRLRLAFADAFRGAGDAATARKLLEGSGSALAEGRARLAAGKPLGTAIDNVREAYSELLLGLAVAINKLNNRALPVALGQISRFADPSSEASTLLTALLLDQQDHDEDALRLLRSIGPGDYFADPAEDAEVRLLLDGGRKDEALARARQLAAQKRRGDDLARLADVLAQVGRNGEAADSYAQAIALAARGEGTEEVWALRLYRANALEEAGRWDEAKREVETALRESPDNPLLLNFLGYGKLERGEDLDQAEALVRRASALRPEDASITDSLGWVQFKRGKISEAIATLERAAQDDPSQSEIREHLGDALYTAGRRFEARHAWRSALVNADDESKPRIQSKIDFGLSHATRSP